MKYAVVVPAYRAEKTIAAVVKDCLRHAPATAGKPDVTVVDDASPDGTSEAARLAGARILRYEKHRGKGGALKTGFRDALERGFDAVVTLDADAQHRPEDIPAMTAAFEAAECDVLIGSRAHLFREMIPRRRRANRFAARAISFFGGISVGDTQSGFRVYSARILRAVNIRAEGYDAESEVLVKAGRRGFRVAEHPIELGFVDGTSTSFYRPTADTAKIVIAVIRSRIFSA